MSAYKTNQRRVLHRGREFHFVSYEGVAANPRRGEDATPATWYLMRAGKRWSVMPQVAGQDVADLDLLLHQWLDQHLESTTFSSVRIDSVSDTTTAPTPSPKTSPMLQPRRGRPRRQG
jgi:hypothetical protein